MAKKLVTILILIAQLSISAVVICFLFERYGELQYFTIDNVFKGIRLSIAVVILALLGRAISKAFKPLSTFDSKLYCLHIALGQIFLVLYLYLRSVVSLLFEKALNFRAPISLIEIVLVVFALIYIAYKRRPERAKLSAYILAPFSGPLLILFLALTLFVFRELPREIALSTDPDQHTFFATQILRFGVVPFTQYEWGARDFHYPSAFAVINFLWARISGLAALEIVTLQPMLQCIIAIFSLLEFILFKLIRNTEITQIKYYFTVSAALILLGLYFALLPHGYQIAHYHLENAAQISSLALIATSLIISFIILSSKWLDLANSNRLLWLLGIVTALLALMNPIYLILPCFIFSICCLTTFIRQRSLTIIFSVIPPFITLILDPYVCAQLLGAYSAPTAKLAQSSVISSQTDLNFLELLKTTSTLLTANFFSLNSFLELYNHPLLPNKTFLFLSLSLLILGLSVSRYFKLTIDQSLFRIILYFLFLFPIPLVLFRSIFRAVPLSFNSEMIYTYFNASMQHTVYLLAFCCVASILLTLYCLSGARTLYLTLSPLICLVLVIYLEPIRNGLSVTNTQARANYCGALGCLQSDDKAALKELERLFLIEYRETKPSNITSKILVLNRIWETRDEKWLVPVGAARVLPFYNTYPAAFYYFQADNDYSFSNYKRYICNRLNINWLKKRSIKYLFVPSQRDNYCLKALNKLLGSEINPELDSEKVIFKQGQSAVIKLY